MSGRHRSDVRRLHVAGTSPVHRLPSEVKLVGLAAFVVVVACTPRHAVWVLAVDALVLVALVATARLPPSLVLARLTVITPFVLFALAIPFVAHGPRTEVVGVAVSADGVWAAWNVVAKAALGAGAAILVSATTTLADVLDGMARLHVPAVLVGVVSWMLRYVELVSSQLGRMRRAMTARGHDPRWLWQVGPVASSVGALFVRSYERGERVHGAMLARGWTGTPALIERDRPTPPQWTAGGAPAVVALGALVAWMVLA